MPLSAPLHRKACASRIWASMLCRDVLLWAALTASAAVSVGKAISGAATRDSACNCHRYCCNCCCSLHPNNQVSTPWAPRLACACEHQKSMALYPNHCVHRTSMAPACNCLRVGFIVVQHAIHRGLRRGLVPIDCHIHTKPYVQLVNTRTATSLHLVTASC